MELLLLLATLPLVIILILWIKLNKLNKRLSSLEKIDFKSKTKELQNIKHETIQEAHKIISTAKSDMETMVSDSVSMLENSPLSKKVEHIKTEVYEANDRLFKLIVDIYDDSVTTKALSDSWEYIDNDRASGLKLTCAGEVDMINWLKPAKRGAIYENNLYIFNEYYKSYIKNKTYYKDDDSSFIEFMDAHISGLKRSLTYSKELNDMSYDDIWEKLTKIGTKYN